MIGSTRLETLTNYLWRSFKKERQNLSLPDGYAFEEVEAERQKLQEAIEESEAVKKLSEEEQKKHFKSIEAVFAELGWQDKRTEEEKWKDRFRRDSEIAENTRRLIRIFRK